VDAVWPIWEAIHKLTEKGGIGMPNAGRGRVRSEWLYERITNLMDGDEWLATELGIVVGRAIHELPDTLSAQDKVIVRITSICPICEPEYGSREPAEEEGSCDT
jgi:hypothetical protein